MYRRIECNRLFRGRSVVAFAVILSAICRFASAEIVLPPVLSDGMVIQQNAPVKVWGTASAGEKISVEMAGQSVCVQAKDGGSWMAVLNPVKAGGPYEMKICGSSTVVIKDVLVGEVWLAGGQSNMELLLRSVNKGDEAVASSENPNLRFFTVQRTEGYPALADENPSFNHWVHASPKEAGVFSAVAYFFARDLQKSLGVPVGIVSCNLGASAGEAWISPNAIQAHENLRYLYDAYLEAKKANDDVALTAYAAEYKKWLTTVKRSSDANARKSMPKMPTTHYSRKLATTLYTSMLSTVIPYTITGAIWYQGENNANTYRGYEYRELLTTLIEDWRTQFENPTMPFGIVQLAAYDWPGDKEHLNNWADLRDAQQYVAQTVPNAFMVVSADYGDKTGIHPKDKEPVGERLALVAETQVYKKSTAEWSGPVYDRMEIQGKNIVLHFSHAAGLLATNGELTEFEVAAADGKFVPAHAAISGETIVVTADTVSSPVAVRYGWKNYFVPTLFNGTGLPASPFRTDSFKLPSQK